MDENNSPRIPTFPNGINKRKIQEILSSHREVKENKERSESFGKKISKGSKPTRQGHDKEGLCKSRNGI
jgi:hypothetical protein